MAVKQYIEINEFMGHLEARGLVVVHRDALLTQPAAELEILRKTLLKKPWLTLKEVCDLKLLPVTSKQALRNWIKNETIRSNEHSVNRKGEITIMTSAVKRLAYISE